ncbi:MAG: ATP-dependent Clp protease ATP-binding subunit ClpA [Pseudomonadota bacterium]
MIAQELEVSLHMAFVEARQQRHEFITVEHLLLALLDNPSGAEVNTPQVAGTDEVDTQPTLGFQRVIQRAIMHVQSTGSGKKEVIGANVLVAIFGEKDSHAVYYLHQQGVTRLDVVNFIAHGIKKSDPPEPVKSGESAEQSEEQGAEFFFNRNVSEIIVENNLAQKVVTDKGEIFEADVVIGGADYHFMETKLLKPAFRSYSDAWWDKKDTKIGYEINFAKYFYKHQSPRELTEIAKDI